MQFSLVNIKYIYIPETRYLQTIEFYLKNLFTEKDSQGWLSRKSWYTYKIFDPKK